MTSRAISEDEIPLLEETLIARQRWRDRLWLIASVGTGFRVSEILSLQWAQLLTSRGEVATEVTVERCKLKNGSGLRRAAVRSRRVVLNQRVRDAIADYLGKFSTLPTGPVFRSRSGGTEGRAITRGQAHRWFKRLARELGLEANRLGCHSTRKRFALQVHRAAQFDLIKTQRVLGHGSPLTTARYLETSQDELDSLVLDLDPSPGVVRQGRVCRIRTPMPRRHGRRPRQ